MKTRPIIFAGLNMNRIGNWIETYSGNRFYPMDPHDDEIDIYDIAHSLSLQCRYNGHCPKFYSVAEHSVYVARELQPSMMLAGLLHDAAEAYLSDIPRPIKRMLPVYKEAEEKIETCVNRLFKVDILAPEIRVADDTIMATEIKQFGMNKRNDWTLAASPCDRVIAYLSPLEAEAEFIGLYNFIRWGGNG